jgi:hypothetical protein
VDNKPGVNGMLGAARGREGRPDGYTILIGTNSTNAALKSLMKQLPYNQDTAFAPLGYMGSVPLIVAGQQRLSREEPARAGEPGQEQGRLRHLRQRQHLRSWSPPRCWPAWPACR